METAKLKKFAQFARRSLLEQVSAKLDLVLAENSAARRESVEAIRKLEEAIKNHGKEQVIERVAYIWFNRFCALRFMDANRYTRIGVVSPAEGQFQPEILMDAKMGHIDEEMVGDKTRQQIFALLDGKAPSRDPQSEAYRLLVVAACNYWHKAMPFLFERIDDYTELLMPDDLLSGNSILAYTREAMTPDVCQDVEVIGWLYQFYISEKKDEVFDGLKKNKKITPENIPAATQLFTPHWIVRYLVENSLGRLWLLNRPQSKLAEQMDYYIKPEQPETDFLRINKPEEIKICDPACGSGHMLTYAFDLLYAIYEEEGYEPAEIPEKILTHNLYGIEIDERAGELAAFALTMKARAKQRRFFNKGVKPNICVLENIHFDEGEIEEYMGFIGRDLFTAPLQTTLRQFEEADNFGSLIRPDVTDVDSMLKILESKNVSGHLFLSLTHQKVLQALRQANYLSPKYHVVIANPPYMGNKGMNANLKTYLRDNYSDVKVDLFSSFTVRIMDATMFGGFIGLMTPFNWMFLSSFEKLRNIILGNSTITNLVRPEFHAFFDSAYVSVCGFTLFNKFEPNYNGAFIDLQKFYGASIQSKKILEAINNPDCGWLYHASAEKLSKIPGKPIAYWISDKVISAFEKEKPLFKRYPVKSGIMTGNDPIFLRTWQEVSVRKISFGLTSSDQMKGFWYPLSKGGEFRKWYGNVEHLINLRDDAFDIRNGGGNYRLREKKWYFQPFVTWSRISSSSIAFRYLHGGVLFADAAPGIFAGEKCTDIIALLNSKLGNYFLAAINPTMNYQTNDIERIPSISLSGTDKRQRLIDQTKFDWDFYETSWDFTSLPLVQVTSGEWPAIREKNILAISHLRIATRIKDAYTKLRTYWREMTLQIQRLEEENNRIFIDAYDLQDELMPEVPLSEITLTCNPHYRYGNDKSEEELEALLLADTMRELVSYAVGCMFGRYALDKPGLILANQGETIEDYLKQVPEPSFPADDDNAIPMLDGDWFTDDIAERFRKFLRVAFGEEHYEENLRFIEAGLGKNGKARDIRDYFLKDFYSDHVKRYKKRPIYWLFSSSKGSFNALIYMHRYRPDTVSVVLNDYLREFRTKLTSHKNHLEAVSISASSSPAEKTKALKEIEKITKMIAEMEEYEREVLYPLATEQVEIDLDDGVKVNYPKFGAALKKIPGLDVKED